MSHKFICESVSEYFYILPRFSAGCSLVHEADALLGTTHNSVIVCYLKGIADEQLKVFSLQ